MNFIDTHTHLYDEAYTDGADAAVLRALEAGVRKMILPDIDSSVREAMFSLAARHQGQVFPCIGLHPTEVGENWREEVGAMLMHKGRKDIVAVGEIGMDTYWSTDFIKEQEEVFRLQLDLALEVGLPVIIHNREATDLILKVLADYRGRGLRGVFHAYSGSYETFRELEKAGEWYVGIGGVITFKKASIAETIRKIPLTSIVTETDAPWLTPAPHRGQRNESAYIPFIVEKIAAQKGLGLEETAESIWNNAHRLFNL